MRMIFKQRFFSWFDSYDIYAESGETIFTVEGRMGWGKKLEISDASGKYLGMLKQEIFTFFPSFEMYLGDRHVGYVRKQFSLFRPSFFLDCNGWTVEGNWFEWDYSIYDRSGNVVATIHKENFNWTDTYVLDVFDPQDAVTVLMIALAIDAEKDNRN